jgi:hypothetical protein
MQTELVDHAREDAIADAGKSVIYHLKISVLEDALLGFVQSFDLGMNGRKPKKELAR